MTKGKRKGGLREDKNNEMALRNEFDRDHANSAFSSQKRLGMRPTTTFFCKMHGMVEEEITLLHRLGISLSKSAAQALETKMRVLALEQSLRAVLESYTCLLLFDNFVRQFGVSVMNLVSAPLRRRGRGRGRRGRRLVSAPTPVGGKPANKQPSLFLVRRVMRHANGVFHPACGWRRGSARTTASRCCRRTRCTRASSSPFGFLTRGWRSAAGCCPSGAT